MMTAMLEVNIQMMMRQSRNRLTYGNDDDEYEGKYAYGYGDDDQAIEQHLNHEETREA